MADHSANISSGGQYASAHAAGAGGASAASAVPGRLCKIVVTTLGTAATSIYDNASAASGTAVFVVPASPAVGTVYDAQMPVANGIFVGGTTNTSGLVVSYNKDTTIGR